MVPPAPICPFRCSKYSFLSGSVVGFRSSGRDAGRENLRTVVYQRKAVSDPGGESDESVVCHRKPGRGTSGSSDGVERERCLLVLAWNGSLLGAFCNSLPEIARRRPSPGDSAAGFLSVRCSAEHGELGLGIHSWTLRYGIEDAVVSVAVPLRVSGNVNWLEN